METLLCDELIEEIFTKLPRNSCSSVSLVSKRWLNLYRNSKTSLSIRIPVQNPTALSSLSALLSHYTSLSSLSLLLSPEPPAGVTSDQILLLVSSLCHRLRALSLSGGAPVSLSSLVSLSRSSTNLTSLCVNLSRPLFLGWLLYFASLRELSLFVSKSQGLGADINRDIGNDDSNPELGIETLCLSGVRNEDWGLGWLWKSCKKLKKLELSNCVGVGDGGSFSSFNNCLKSIQEVELRTSRTIVDGVLMKLSENCDSLESLLIHDGGSREGLLSFFSQCRFRLRKLDLRLPLDLDNEHLLAASARFGTTLSSIRLHSGCLLTGEGLKALGVSASAGLEELGLISCNIVEREPGLLTTLGQSLRRLKSLDLSYNEDLVDKELVSMLASCRGLVDLKLRSCKRLTGSALVSMSRGCKDLESVDVMNCRGIEANAIEVFVVNSPRLRRVRVEESKLSEATRHWAISKFIELVS